MGTGLSDLPLELFAMILHYAILVRGGKLALRLRLVNKTFDQEITRLLKTFRFPHTLFQNTWRWHRKTYLTPYLEHWVLHEPANGNQLLTSIRRVAEEVHEKIDPNLLQLLTLEDCVKKLCREINLNPNPKAFNTIFEWKGPVSKEDYQSILLAAGICTNILSIVRQSPNEPEWMSSRLRPLGRHIDHVLFGDYNRMAARLGSKEVLGFLMTTGVPVVRRNLRTDLFIFAAQFGRIDIVRFIWDFKREEVPWDLTSGNQTKEHSLLYNARDTGSIEVLEFVEELLKLHPNPHICGYQAKRTLGGCILFGRLDTTARLIQLGADPADWPWPSTTPPPDWLRNKPIELACTLGHIKIVELLLVHGACPRVALNAAAKSGRKELVQILLSRGTAPGKAVSIAAESGHYDIVQLLLDAGANPNERAGPSFCTPPPPPPWQSPLVSAIRREHTRMFRLLIERGADLDSAAKDCVECAKQNGLDSMLQLLKDYSVGASSLTTARGPATAPLPNPKRSATDLELERSGKRGRLDRDVDLRDGEDRAA